MNTITGLLKRNEMSSKAAVQIARLEAHAALEAINGGEVEMGEPDSVIAELVREKLEGSLSGVWAETSIKGRFPIKGD